MIIWSQLRKTRQRTDILGKLIGKIIIIEISSENLKVYLTLHEIIIIVVSTRAVLSLSST